MPYTHAHWMGRLRQRSDMSSNLVHLTRDSEEFGDSRDVLLKILLDKALVGSSNDGFICGDRTAVCFQDAPLYSIAQNVRFEQELAQETGLPQRYSGIGIALPKPYLYRRGARPVIYEDRDTAKGFLPEDEWWRIVRLDLSTDACFIDWTHEREWRAPGKLEFDLKQVTIVVVSLGNFRRIARQYEEATGDELISLIRGVVTLNDILY